MHSYYHCQQQCGERFRADTANTAFIRLLQAFETTLESQELYLKFLADTFKSNDADQLKKRAAREKQIVALEVRIETVTDKFVDGLIGQADFKNTKQKV